MDLTYDSVKQTKVCTKCGEEKALGEFRQKGLRCRSCRDEAKKLWYRKNKKRVYEYHRRYREENSEVMNAKRRKVRKLHPDTLRKQDRRRYRDNPKRKSRCIARAREWGVNNPEIIKRIHKKAKAKMIEQLTDPYIKDLICGGSVLTRGDIPDEMVRIRRTILKSKRYLRSIESGKSKKRDQGISEESRRRVG